MPVSISSYSGSSRVRCAIARDEVVVREGPLRVLVQHPHVGMGRRRVEVEVVLLDVLAVVALGPGQAEEALLQDRVLPVPQRQREADLLLAIADAGDAVLVPAIGARSGMVVREVFPRLAVLAVVLAHGAPCAIADVRAPSAPVASGTAGGLQPEMFWRTRLAHAAVTWRRLGALDVPRGAAASGEGTVQGTPYDT